MKMTRQREIIISLLQKEEGASDYLHLFEPDMFSGVEKKVMELLKAGEKVDISDGKLMRELGLSATEIAGLIVDYYDYRGWLNVEDYQDYSFRLRERKALELAKEGKWRSAVRALKVDEKAVEDWDFYYRYLEEIRANVKNPDHDGYQGYTTGIGKLDENTSGLIKKKVWVIGGYNAYGKTYLMTNIVNKLICTEAKVCVLSLEMSREDIINRLIAERIEKGVFELAKMENKKIVENEYEAIKGSFEKGTFLLTDKVRELSEITSYLRREKRKRGLDVVFIDFLQLIVDKSSEGSYEQTRNVAVTLQALAQELNVCMVLLSQVSNESVRNKSNDVYGFKGAGEIGQIADVAIKIHRERIDGELSRDYTLDLVKNRSGRSGLIFCTIDFPSGHIREKAKEDYEVGEDEEGIL